MKARGCFLWAGIIVIASIALMAIIGSLLPAKNSPNLVARSLQKAPTLRSISTNTPPVDFCIRATNFEKRSVDALKAGERKSAYHLAQKGITAERSCGSTNEAMIGKGYLLSIRAFAEHGLPYGDSQTDLNQPEQLLEKCQGTPGIYGTHLAAECESQEQDDIQTQTNWEMGK